MTQAPSGSLGIYIADSGLVCCLCDQPIDQGELVKEIGSRYATLPCVDKALDWIVSARDKKRTGA